MSEEKAAVVVLNFNGRYFLEKFLPGIILNSAPYPVIVADNGSTDDSVAFMQSNHPGIKLIRNGANYGYAKGYNLALSQITAEYFILLNSDVEVTPEWITPVLKLMDRDKNIAACQPKILDFKLRDTFEYAGASGGFIDKLGYPFCRGRIFNALEKDMGQFNEAHQVFWATGACLFVRSDAFNRAGKLDDAYFAHMEEIDLCWRLKNLGYTIYVEPASVIYHIGGGTLNKLSRQKTFLNFRNNLTTLVKNHPPKNLFLKVILRMVLDGIAAFKFLFEGQGKHFIAVIHAHFSFYSRLSQIMSERKRLTRVPGFRYNISYMYKGNIVSEHFLQKKNKFNELNRGFFS